MPLLEEREALKGIAGKRSVGATEADSNQQTPARIGQRALRAPHQKQAKDEAAGDVDQQRAVGEGGSDGSGDKAAYDVTQAGAHNGAERDPQIGKHDSEFSLPPQQANYGLAVQSK